MPDSERGPTGTGGWLANACADAARRTATVPRTILPKSWPSLQADSGKSPRPMTAATVTHAPAHAFLKVGERGYVVEVDGWRHFRYSRPLDGGGIETCDAPIIAGRVEVREDS